MGNCRSKNDDNTPRNTPRATNRTDAKYCTIKTEKGVLLSPPEIVKGEHLDINVDGEWNVTRDLDRCMGVGYEAVWEIVTDGDEITMTQQRGTACWGFLPDTVFNRMGRPCHMKFTTARLTKVAPGRWEGKFACCQTLTLTVVSEHELHHSPGFPEGGYTLTR